MTSRAYNVFWWGSAIIVMACGATFARVQHKWIPMVIAFVVTVVVLIVRFRELNRQSNESQED